MTKPVSVAGFVGYNHCHTPRHRIKEVLDVSLGYSSQCGFLIFPKRSGKKVVYPSLVVVKAWSASFRLVIYRENKQAKEAIQSDGGSAECMEGLRTPKPQPQMKRWLFSVPTMRTRVCTGEI
ncbi:hypothetical protein TNCV_4422311 [Trichonephila clavipes]|nr:hypothetical protein TNCV_4422311 [Trichonephila clavipes]